MSDLHPIETLIDRGKKIEAIKEYRALTGVGLREAKDAVEGFQARRQWPLGVVLPHEIVPAPTSPPSRSGQLELIERHLAANEIIHAIKELRARTGWGLKESKDAVDHHRASGSWPAYVLAALGEPAPAPSPPASVPVAASEARTAVLDAVARHLGYAPDVQLVAGARRAGHDGHLVMLRECACFVGHDRGQRRVDLVIPCDAVMRTEVDVRVQATLYVSVGHVHERFELGAAAAEAALALFRVFAR